MDFVKTLTNPYVIAAGVGIGVVLLVTSKAKAAPAQAGVVYSAASDSYNAAALAAQTDQVSSWLDFQGKQMSANTDLGKARLGSETTRYVETLSFLKNSNDNAVQVARQSIISKAGVSQGLITASANLSADQGMQLARMALASTSAAVDSYGIRVKGEVDKQMSTDSIAIARATGASNVAIAYANGNASVEIAKAQASAVKHGSTMNAISNGLNAVASVVKKVI